MRRFVKYGFYDLRKAGFLKLEGEIGLAVESGKDPVHFKEKCHLLWKDVGCSLTKVGNYCFDMLEPIYSCLMTLNFKIKALPETLVKGVGDRYCFQWLS